MRQNQKNVAVLLAGGVGTRIGLAIPKQLLKISGKPIMEHTLATLDAHPDVDEVVVMMAQGHLDAVRAMVAQGDTNRVMDELWELGARAILVTSIHACRI